VNQLVHRYTEVNSK